jgi:hypothetical protein
MLLPARDIEFYSSSIFSGDASQKFADFIAFSLGHIDPVALREDGE